MVISVERHKLITERFGEQRPSAAGRLPASVASKLTAAKIPYSSYPHVIETILAFSDYPTLLLFRATSSDIKAKADRALCDGKLKVELRRTSRDSHVQQATSNGSSRSSDLEVVLRSGHGVLPFLGQEERKLAFSLSHTVDIDGACFSFPATAGLLSPPELDSLFHPLQASLRRAMQSLPRSAKVIIAHEPDHGPPLFLPPADHLIFTCDAHCECRQFYRGPSHSASHITLRMTAELQPSSSRPRLANYCQLIVLALEPSVQRLTMSADLGDDIVSALVFHRGERMDFTQSDRNKPNENLDLEIRLKQPGNFPAWASHFGFAPNQVHGMLVSDDTE
ncbi:hypothetical protein A1Q2_02731 [Trichosporon asahii var. asahii CBS 8904]|uniref:Uncharacterized protein n=2 Tax=Trichosporon asahii var. asahii TaxID=189963 RepID=K1VFT3_TRIAC|nr:hypothetical protein A1Q1_07227 [Trichosporon asahii var. asahii CBS 2479]EJT51560.1 hypothetical protein A1Q1_07227 [Trichosporon asahii var. asahii CBS 2479]EKD02950.1 hypothetical protein A1Q2_02731 [Trichosporon asahii var. asahii CBS 8904]